MSREMLRASAAVLALLCTLPAQAGLFSDDTARAQINAIKAQLDTDRTQFESTAQRLEAVTQNQVDYYNQIESVKADIARMRGQLEELAYNLDAAQKRQQDFYLDLDNRLRKIEAASQSPQSESGGAKDQAVMDVDAAAMRSYEAALVALKGSDFKSAVSGFESFIKAAPNSPQQPSAHFFAAYCFSQLKQPGKAAELYGRLAVTWPEDEHAPDAMLGLADSLEALGKPKEARGVLTTLVEKYPESDAGKQAKAKLKKK